MFAIQEKGDMTTCHCSKNVAMKDYVLRTLKSSLCGWCLSHHSYVKDSKSHDWMVNTSAPYFGDPNFDFWPTMLASTAFPIHKSLFAVNKNKQKFAHYFTDYCNLLFVSQTLLQSSYDDA
jgi:hypothetical protein